MSIMTVTRLVSVTPLTASPALYLYPPCMRYDCCFSPRVWYWYWYCLLLRYVGRPYLFLKVLYYYSLTTTAIRMEAVSAKVQ